MHDSMHDAGNRTAAQPEPRAPRDLAWILLGPHGIRAGWSIFLFAAAYYFLQIVLGGAFFSAGILDETSGNTPTSLLAAELTALFALSGATALMALIEHRRFLSYNLTGPRRPAHFFAGVAAGFLTLSLLVGTLHWGGWLRMAAAPLSGPQALGFAAEWAGAFLVVGLFEEGFFRGFPLVTLTRGINFWWALAVEIAICAYLAFAPGEGAGGVYAAAALGFVPCLLLHRRSAPSHGGFWQAAWVTSTFFGFYHTANHGESAIGIFAAALIGFVFCVSIRLTGSAWWAIGCHAAWDWGETFFYGTADSGLTPHGCYLVSTPSGNPLWSGGAVGPEGSVLVLGVILLLLIVVLLYGRFTSPARTPA